MSRDQNRRQFDAEFKREAVRLSQEPGRTMASVARDLGISETNLWRWRKKLAESGDSAFPGTGHVSKEEEELRRLVWAIESASDGIGISDVTGKSIYHNNDKWILR